MKSLKWIGWKAWKIMEKGKGIRREGEWWEYVPVAMGKVVLAEARDPAGNVVKRDG